MGGMMSWMGGAMIAWWLITLAFLVLLVIGIVWLVRAFPRQLEPRGHRTALDELALRYAGGEVDRETFVTTRDELSRS
jgi:uncharacterized membrane protein